MAHTQGKKHQANLARRAAKEAKEAPQQLAPEKPRIEPKKFVKIGRPGYRVTKQKDPENGQQSLLFQVDYPGKKNRIKNLRFKDTNIFFNVININILLPYFRNS